MGNDFLLELGTEEMPPGDIAGAGEQLRENTEAFLDQQRIDHGDARIYYTPRRLALLVNGVAEAQRPMSRRVLGPPRKAAFDGEGAPTQAARGFAASQGVDLEDLTLITTEKGEYVAIEKVESGRPTAELLPDSLPGLILSLNFRKSMRWGTQAVRFVRPIRWIVALLGDNLIGFEIAGVRSGRQSRGHRFLAKGQLSISRPADYLRTVQSGYVIADPEARRERIRRMVEDLVRQQGGQLVEDEDLLTEVTNLTEYPSAYLGSFDESFLSLPRDVVVTAMREHQHYFAIDDGMGALLPAFVGIVNTSTDNIDVIRKGNEYVLRARLDDARFYWEQDRKSSLAEKVLSLKGMVWQEGLGTLFDKTERVVALTRFLAQRVGDVRQEVAERGAYLAKADLVTEMIRDGKEFTSLQGTMGKEYALASGEPEDVAACIEEHYLPRFPGDALPATREGAIVAIADKADSIAGCFLAGIIPTGSQDPYGLRRMASGLVSVTLAHRFGFALRGLVERAVAAYEKVKATGQGANLTKTITDFITQRLRTLLEEKGIGYDLVDASLAVEFDDLCEAYDRATALNRQRSTPGFVQLVIGQKRVNNILKTVSGLPSPDRSLFESRAETLLLERIERIDEDLTRALAERDYDRALILLLSLRQPIDDLFDEVLIMAEDEAIRTNRLALVNRAREPFLRLADFSRLVVEGE
jgi:glycyl-tRNA synthetase beta chain